MGVNDIAGGIDATRVPTTGGEVAQAIQEQVRRKALRVLRRHRALDLVPMLGLGLGLDGVPGRRCGHCSGHMPPGHKRRQRYCSLSCSQAAREAAKRAGDVR